MTQNFSPTSITSPFTGFNLSPTINQTGGANGITRGLYINPTLTSAADFRAIEVTAGKVIVPTAANSNEAINKGQLESYTASQLAGKMNNPSLTASYIPKALTATTIGNSRIVDTNTYLGIGTVNTPTKDITLGNQFDREIGIEESDNTSTGKSLVIKGGRNINYAYNVNFNSLNLIEKQYMGYAVSPVTGSVYVAVYTDDIYKQTDGVGPFVAMGIDPYQFTNVVCHQNGNVYFSTNGDTVFVQIGGTGSFISTGLNTSNAWLDIHITSSGHVYACQFNGSIWKQTNGTGSFVDLGQTLRRWGTLTSDIYGNVYAGVTDGDIYKQTGGTGDFIAIGQSSPLGYSSIYSDLQGKLFGAVYGGGIYEITGTTKIKTTHPDRYWRKTFLNPNGNIYIAVSGIDGNIYMQNNNTTGTPNLQGGTLKLYSGTGKGTGASDIEMYTGQVLASGTDMQTSTLRAKIDNTGLMTLPSVTNALIDADATGKAVVTKEYAEAKYTSQSRSIQCIHQSNITLPSNDNIIANNFGFDTYWGDTGTSTLATWLASIAWKMTPHAMCYLDTYLMGVSLDETTTVGIVNPFRLMIVAIPNVAGLGVTKYTLYDSTPSFNSVKGVNIVINSTQIIPSGYGIYVFFANNYTTHGLVPVFKKMTLTLILQDA